VSSPSRLRPHFVFTGLNVVGESHASDRHECCWEIVSKKLDVLISLYATISARIERIEGKSGTPTLLSTAERGQSITPADGQRVVISANSSAATASSPTTQKRITLDPAVLDDIQINCAASDTHFALSLLRLLYSRSDLNGKTANGSSKKDPLSPTRMNYIKRMVKQRYFANLTDTEYAKKWRRCVCGGNKQCDKPSGEPVCGHSCRSRADSPKGLCPTLL
jgi:hypothetical protein